MTRWRSEYRVPSTFFHFGDRHFSYTANIGYFIDENQRIVSVLKKKKEVTGEWSCFSDFLSEELRASEELEEELHPAKWQS